MPSPIRTLCRIRPVNLREQASEIGQVVHKVDAETVELNHDQMIKTFQFGAAFECGTQAEIYNFCKDAVDAAMAGTNSCIIAYGQTGAGKTYSMYGPNLRDEAEALMGVVPRVAQQVFATAEIPEMKAEIKVSMLELRARGEIIVDLLQADALAVKPKIRWVPSGPGAVENAVEATCRNSEELLSQIEQAFDRRLVHLTHMGCQSSRSHMCAILTVSATGGPTGRLVMVDLCGSERVSRTRHAGEFDEARGIARSLTSLQQVLRSFLLGAEHVPYRDSKLTMLLKGCLAQTVLIVACSPSSLCNDETLNSFRFATRMTQ